jgi:hypothetical protein
VTTDDLHTFRNIIRKFRKINDVFLLLERTKSALIEQTNSNDTCRRTWEGLTLYTDIEVQSIDIRTT